MASTFQNRLVGTVIVVALAVIFLPNILDGKKDDNAALTMQIPSKPSLQRFTYEQDFSVEEIQNRSGREVEIVSEQAVDDDEQTAENKQPLETEQAPVTKQPTTANKLFLTRPAPRKPRISLWLTLTRWMTQTKVGLFSWGALNM